MKSRILSILITLALIGAFVWAIQGPDREEVSCDDKDDVVLTTIRNGFMNVRVTGLVYLEENGDINLKYEGSVAKLPFPKEEITSLKLGQYLLGVNDEVFQDCKHLRKMVIHDDVRSLGARSFAGCVSLEKLRLPASLTNLGDGAFAGCTSLTSLTLPDGLHLETIGADVFADCPITEVSLGKSWQGDEARLAQLSQLLPGFDLTNAEYHTEYTQEQLITAASCAAAAVVVLVIIVVVAVRKNAQKKEALREAEEKERLEEEEG